MKDFSLEFVLFFWVLLAPMMVGVLVFAVISPEVNEDPVWVEAERDFYRAEMLKSKQKLKTIRKTVEETNAALARLPPRRCMFLDE